MTRRPGQPRARSSCSTAAAPASSTGVAAHRLRGHRAAGRGAELLRPEITTRDIDRGEYAALPSERDHRGAGLVPQDLARHASSTGADDLLDVALDDAALPAAVRDRLASGEIRAGARDRSGHRGGRRAEPGVRAAATRPGPGCRSTRSRPRSCPGSVCVTTCATRSWSPSRSRAPPPTRTAPSIWPVRAAPRWCRSSTGARATSSTRATVSSTRRTAATSRWRWLPRRRSTRRSQPAPCSRTRSREPSRATR